MTIMSDNWITKMALEENMIAPFVDGQKKRWNNFLWSFFIWI